MERVACLGLGAMGRRMARRLIDAGHDVRVWSRSGAPAGEPALRGRCRRTPRAAAADATIVISVVTDDRASRQVWLDPEEGALAGLGTGALAIESSTLSPGWAAELASRAAEAGVGFLDAPVVGSRPQAESGALVYLVGGRARDLERARPFLSVLGSAIHALGPTPNGAHAKLVVNTIFSAQVALLGELIGEDALGGLDAMTLLEVLGALPTTSPAAKVAAAGIVSRKFDPLFPIALVAKDLRYAAAAGTERGARLPLTERLVEIFERAVAEGLGDANITAVAELYAPTKPRRST